MKLKKYIAIAFMGFTILSCNNFEDINRNSDSANKVNSSLLATGAIMGIIKPSVGAGFVDSQFIPKYMGWGEGSRASQYNDFGRDNFGGYTLLKDYRLMAELSDEQNKDAYEALALLLETYRLYNYTISVGDIPFKEILKGKEGVLTPKYDAQKDVFVGLLANLDRAYELFTKAKPFAGDPIFNGNVEKWAKITTAFQLRILINLSKKESDTDLNVKEKFNSIYKNGALMQSNADNFQLLFSDKAGQIYPFHNSRNKHSTYPMLSSTLMDLLKEHEDYRLFYYASPSKAKIDSGKDASQWDAYTGVDVSSPIEDIKTVFTSNDFCGLNKRYVDYISGEPYIIMGYAEQNFILAEASLRGWIAENPSVFYKKGIRASMEAIGGNTPDDVIYHYGRKITEEVIQTLLGRKSIQLDGTFEQNLKKVLEQKYIAAFMQLPYQPYYDYRRTGYPVLPINTVTNQNFKEPTKIPVRWLYPDAEYSYNKENVEEAVKKQYDGVDEVNKLMWLLK